MSRLRMYWVFEIPYNFGAILCVYNHYQMTKLNVPIIKFTNWYQSIASTIHSALHRKTCKFFSRHLIVTSIHNHSNSQSIQPEIDFSLIFKCVLSIECKWENWLTMYVSMNLFQTHLFGIFPSILTMQKQAVNSILKHLG